MGYCFCIFQHHINNSVMTDIKTLYIDDLCVDEKVRNSGIGTILFDAVEKFAKEQQCGSMTLNVWKFNEGAKLFYENNGMSIQRFTLEKNI